MSSKIKIPFIRSPYNYDVEAASNEAALPADKYGESLTVQSMTDDADINIIMKRYGITGRLPENPRVPEYGDFMDIGDYQSALAAVKDAQEKFMSFPADVRAKFDNDPQLMLDFCSDPENREEMRKLGLLKPDVSVTIAPTVDVPPKEKVDGNK